MKSGQVVWLVLGTLGVAVPAAAQTFPSKTITIVSPAPAGGVTDIIGRALAQRFSKAFGQQAVVENKPGANNQLAAEYIVNSVPDGHTLFIAPDGTFVANPSLYPKLPYDPYKSFTPISGLMIINHGLILSKGFAPNTVAELIALAKQKPGEINYGTYGIGSSGHLNMVLLETMAGLKLQARSYRSAACTVRRLRVHVSSTNADAVPVRSEACHIGSRYVNWFATRFWNRYASSESLVTMRVSEIEYEP